MGTVHNDILVSIIIPCYNSEAYVSEAIESALNQTYPACEVIVIDDGSTDESVKRIESFGSSITFETSVNKGACAARNRGLEMANGQYIKFLDSDDVLMPNVIEEQVKTISQLPPKSIGYGYYRWFGDRNSEHKRTPEGAYSPNIADVILRSIVTSLSLYPADALKHVGGFDVRLKFGQEWNLHLKLAVAGFDFVYQEIDVYRCRFHDSETRISNKKRSAEEAIKNITFGFEPLNNIHDDLVTAAMASYYWKKGREFIYKYGDVVGARAFFAEARKVSPRGYKYYFTTKYRFQTILLGDVLPDRLMIKVKRLTNP